jgi:glycosyltransferase involved in cell wall biosynthesis
MKLRAELGLAQADPVIGTIARLGERRKGIADFLDMAVTVASRRQDARFVIVGDGDMRLALERYAADLGLSDRVRFTGERHDIPEILALMRVFVMPSHYEAGPYTLLEAMAMGRPVVSTSTGLAPEVIENGHSGFLVPIGNAQSLARAVLLLLDNDHLLQRFGTRGRRQVERRHSLTAMVDATVDAYGGIG